jgi:hypothetical protein
MKKILFVLGFGLTLALVSCNFQPDEIPLPPATEGNDTVETVATDDENTDTETEIVIENDDVVEEVDDENETATEGNDTVEIEYQNLPKYFNLNENTRLNINWNYSNANAIINYSDSISFNMEYDSTTKIITVSINEGGRAKITNVVIIGDDLCIFIK